MSWDVVVVGAGSSGCALAGRLSEDPHRRVLLLEAGPAVTDPAQFPDDVRAVASLAAADPDGPHTWDVGVELAPGRRTRVGRGRLLGGSSAVNGANHLRATRADLDSWPGWSYEAVLPYYVRGEHDLDVRGPLHGDAGPVPVVRPAGELRAAVTERFLDAAARIGVPVEPDKNGDAPPGAGLVPANVRRGVRVNAAMAYVLPHLARPNLTVRGDVTVARVLLDGDRAVGVEGIGPDGAGERIEAGEVVLSAGSVCTPQLLALSGIGPPDALRAAGLPVRHARPGVGRGYSDHPSVYLAFPDTTGGAALHPEAPGAQAAVHLDAGDDPAGDLEILLFARPFAPGGPCHLMCALQAPESRGVMVFDAPVPGGTPRLEHRYLASGHDRARMRQVVRRAGDLLAAGALALGPVDGLDDRGLDAWIDAHLTTSAHLCATARLGTADDPGAVVDPELRVHGLRGLRVVDTSVLPTVPRRGPAATALVLGERAADLIAGAGS